MMRKNYILSNIFMLVLGLSLYSQQQTQDTEIRWTGIETRTLNGTELKTPGFADAVNMDRYGLLPVFSKLFPIPAPGLSYKFGIKNTEFIPFENQQQIAEVADINLAGENIELHSDIISIRNKYYSQLQLLPMRYNPESGQYEKLVKFTIVATPEPEEVFKYSRTKNRYASSSVLAQGNWFKIGVAENGIYKLTYQMLEDLGMNPSQVNPAEIKIYGNGGGMLPEKNEDFQKDDLIENAIWISGGADGSFDPEDYILFYGQSPHVWEYVPLKLAFEFHKHRYSERNYYFITAGPGEGKRIESLAQSTQQPDEIITDYNDYAVHERDVINLIRSGAEWYGEEFSDVLTHDFTFEFPHRNVEQNVYFVGEYAGRTHLVSEFTVDMNGDSLTSVTVNSIPPGSITQYANSINTVKRFKELDSKNLTFTVSFDQPGDESIGWLNYIEVNVMSHLTFDGNQLDFRNVYATDEGQVSEFQIQGVNDRFSVWDVTDPLAPKAIEITMESDMAKMRVSTDSLREFIGFDESHFPEPELVGMVENQNLHAMSGKDFLIISHPNFMAQAERLKELHEELDQMEIAIATPQQIYNEFSSGVQDPTAIRHFVKMVYERSGNPPALKYLLLFGDGSYDPKDRLAEGRNFIPTFQSKQSLWYTSSYVTDDYFGLMDENEGQDAAGNVDIGIGRLPVNSPEEAEQMVDKLDRYMHLNDHTCGTWRNSMCFIADDEDYNLHIYQADTVLVKDIQRKNKTVNINKIYFDAYKQESSTAGHRYPQVTDAFNEQVNKGTLVMNYTGHGGETGLAHEHVIQIADINSWDNYYHMPVFITATCEFSRFDNPLMTSAGELVLLNHDGGGIALLTTTRLAFASSNLTLNKRIYDTLFRASPGNYPRLGDLIMFSKNPSNTNIRNFVLLGNPAMPLALPQYSVVTDSINGLPAQSFRDTLKAKGRVNISGRVTGHEDGKSTLENFNGEIYLQLFDKPEEITTLANDPRSIPYEFKLQNNVLYKGKSSVKNGHFSFEFVIPKDISYEYGRGKLSFYASDSISDAAGEFQNLLIGGYDDQAAADNSGPQIELYLNDSLFVEGSVINNHPLMLAKLSDQSGINAMGTGIGHDIVATLNGSYRQSFILNEYFEPLIDDYSSGTIEFPMSGLSNGKHTLELKAWDMYNNSSTKSIGFVVSDSLPVDLLQVYNYPNPFSSETWFTFRHNQFSEEVTVEIEIFNFNGQHVRTIGPEKVFSNGYYIEPIRWNGTAPNGSKLRPGWYVYKVKVYNSIGLHSQMVQKMIITK